MVGEVHFDAQIRELLLQHFLIDQIVFDDKDALWIVATRDLASVAALACEALTAGALLRGGLARLAEKSLVLLGLLRRAAT